MSIAYTIYTTKGIIKTTARLRSVPVSALGESLWPWSAHGRPSQASLGPPPASKVGIGLLDRRREDTSQHTRYTEGQLNDRVYDSSVIIIASLRQFSPREALLKLQPFIAVSNSLPMIRLVSVCSYGCICHTHVQVKDGRGSPGESVSVPNRWH